MTPNTRDYMIQTSHYFEDYASSELSSSRRILSTPSGFAKSTLFHIQEIGRLKSLVSHTSSRRRLDSYLITAVLSGSGTFTFEKHVYPASAGDLVFIDCMRPYSHRSSDSDPWELEWVHFQGPQMSRYYEYFEKQAGSILIRPKHLPEYTGILENLLALAPQKRADAELVISNLLNRLITLALTEKSAPPADSPSPDSVKMEEIRAYLDEHFQKHLSLDSVAAEFFISKFHMAREFKKAYGITVVSYIISKRITHAKGLLRFTEMHIEEISRICGVDDNSYFNKLFRKVEGITASEYRKKWREG